MSKTLDICLSPAQFSLFDVKGKVVVIIDVLRATSTINAALENGVKEVIPVSSIEEAKKYKAEGYLCGAERNGKKYEGFDLRNSPFEYMSENLKGKSVVLTTSNGTRALKMAENADQVITGSFLNLSSVVAFLKEQEKDIILFCSGWKDRFSLEDTLCAGAIASKSGIETTSDSCFTAKHLFQFHEKDLLSAVKQSNHYHRLAHNGVIKDIEFCSTTDKYTSIPKWNGKSITVV